jgi:hypothetical protein
LPFTFYQSVLIKWPQLEYNIGVPENVLKDHSVNKAVQKKLKSAGIKVLLPKKLEIQDQSKDQVDQTKSTPESLKKTPPRQNLKK